jgi:hypothetical protein
MAGSPIVVSPSQGSWDEVVNHRHQHPQCQHLVPTNGPLSIMAGITAGSKCALLVMVASYYPGVSKGLRLVLLGLVSKGLRFGLMPCPGAEVRVRASHCSPSDRLGWRRLARPSLDGNSRLRAEPNSRRIPSLMPNRLSNVTELLI